MGAMYKEIIFRKTLPVIIILFLAMIFLISFLKLVEVMGLIPVEMSRILDVICLVSLSLFGFYEYEKCKVQYKYSIIGDELIVHKLKGEEQILVEDIKIHDIQYIGYISKLSNRKKNLKTKKYVCSILNINKFCCVYNHGGRNYKMYFEPSKDLVDKVKRIQDKQHAFYHQQDNFNVNNGDCTILKV